ncbi:MAG: ACT domain-containing protein [Chloroflexota bacterium]|nr:ACT domain-containing protein [Chloroflexota bacterium]MDE2685118.1 ACT domain-containing protein [Chloroflexota bacterium]
MNQPNLVNRIVIMADNEVGIIADLTAALANEGINLETINAETTGGHGAIVLTVDNYDRALYVLNQAGFKAVGDDALVVRLPDEPGALANVAGSLKDAGVNIESMHILSRQAGYTMIALKTDNRAEAVAAIGSDFIV